MTPNEFKAWFDGFSDAINGAPNEEQFERIKEQVGKIADSAPTLVGDRYYLPTDLPRLDNPHVNWPHWYTTI